MTNGGNMGLEWNGHGSMERWQDARRLAILHACKPGLFVVSRRDKAPELTINDADEHIRECETQPTLGRLLLIAGVGALIWTAAIAVWLRYGAAVLHMMR